MEKLLTTNGELVTLTDDTRDLGYGLQVKVIYSDGSEGWESPNDLKD